MLKQKERADDDNSDDGEVLPRGFPKPNCGDEPHSPNNSKRPKKQKYRSLKEIYASLDAKPFKIDADFARPSKEELRAMNKTRLICIKCREEDPNLLISDVIEGKKTCRHPEALKHLTRMM